ncbi:MAG: hypothetical protein WC651_03500, partial [Candidatus Gracilibacteria bacterium]
LIATNCYGVPAPATGDAGDKTLCQGYKETIEKQTTAVNSETTQPMKDIDNPCNWNKLTFGSSMTDRVTIPLYYDSSGFTTTKLEYLSDLDKGVNPENIVRPFKNGDKNFILRVRTPCLPCYDKDTKGNEIPEDGKRTCEGVDTNNKPRSRFYCEDKDRYVLDTKDVTEKDASKKDDMVVSWQITGKCGNDDCGMIQYKEGDSDTKGFSAIIESFINSDSILFDPIHNKHIIIDTTTTKNEDKPKAKDTSNYAGPKPLILDKLKEMKQPVFSMFLSGKLLTADEEQFVPYLEYQFLTDTPIGQAQIESEIIVIINNTFYVQKLEKAEKRPLIDFAIQS